MKKNKIMAVMAAAIMAVSAVPAAAAVPASALPAASSTTAYVEFSSLSDLNDHISKHGGDVILRDPWTDMSATVDDVQSIWVPAGFSQYENSIDNILFCNEYVSVNFSFKNSSYKMYAFGNSTAGKMHYDSMKTSADKQKVDGRTVYRSGSYYCWKQSGSYFMLVSNVNAFSYCSAEEYILPEYTAEGISYIGGKKYYVQSDGSYYVGWKTINGSKYFFGMDGAAITQNMIIGNVRYTFEPSGVCTGTYTGWLDMEGFRYYCKNGRFVTGVNKISGKTYTFSSEGILLSVDS
ncbi:MAG: hypothetical protein HDT25_03415 [Ruminococcus sp.]|nr:hypothetical protein [Ruminococcus sp.]